MTRQILETIIFVDPSLPYGAESGKVLRLIALLKDSPKQLPSIPCLSERSKIATESLKHAKSKKRALLGAPHRSDCITDLYIHEAAARVMLSEDPEQYLKEHVDRMWNVAREATNAFWPARKVKSCRATHPIVGNPGYLNSLLVPAGFLAWGIREYRKSLDIFFACLCTKSRSFPLAFLAGILAYTWKGWRPPAFSVLLLGAPIAFYSFAKRIFLWKKQSTPRRAFRRVCKAAIKDKKVYGYGNFAFAIEDYWEEYLGKDPHKHVLYERWSDKPHDQFMEWKVTCGADFFPIYWKILKRAKSPSVAGAFAAHMVCLKFLFRTAAASIQESFLIALIEKDYPHPETTYLFPQYYKSQEKPFLHRDRAWYNGFEVLDSVACQSLERVRALIDLEPIEFDGLTKIAKSIAKEAVGPLKAAWECMLKEDDYPERFYRYYLFLQAIKDPDSGEWGNLVRGMSPKRFELG